VDHARQPTKDNNLVTELFLGDSMNRDLKNIMYYAA